MNTFNKHLFINNICLHEMEYTLEQIDEIKDDCEFARWLHDERFINIEGVVCGKCGAHMDLQGGSFLFVEIWK